MKVKPAEGRMVRDPLPPYQLLPAEGREVPDNQYWRRRIRDHDVEVITAEAAHPPAHHRHRGTE